jgi:hypothetical protein
MWPVHVGFVVDKVVVGEVLLRILQLLPVNVIPPVLHTQFPLTYHRHYTSITLRIGVLT